ncbi:MAG: hypothetical protein K2X27_01900 [Candidatus Obscuribacterales bacterium]|nr:hypothetical protein [Candidatus Obscuribacterales bacterium]
MMQKEKDLLKIALWVCSGILLGAAIMAAVQHFSTEPTTLAETSPSAGQASEQTKSAQTMPASPYPVAAGLAALNAASNQNPAPAQGMIVQTNDGQNIQLAPGTSYSETNSGYPICTGRRAVDWAPASIPAQDYQNQEIDQGPPQPIGRNGLLANPSSDPPSSHGLAYSRSYQ